MRLQIAFYGATLSKQHRVILALWGRVRKPKTRQRSLRMTSAILETDVDEMDLTS